MNLTIPIVTKEKFQEILMRHLLGNHKDYTIEDLFLELLKNGFPKLDFDNLGKSLETMFVCLPTVIVDIKDNQFCWIVSGNKAIVIDKTTVYKENN